MKKETFKLDNKMLWIGAGLAVTAAGFGVWYFLKKRKICKSANPQGSAAMGGALLNKSARIFHFLRISPSDGHCWCS